MINIALDFANNQFFFLQYFCKLNLSVKTSEF